jgi:transcriptional repressor NrdR
MHCPHCGSPGNKVIESRTSSNGGAIRRRRKCNACGHRFTSYERIEDKQFMVIKRDGRREPFERSKIEKGVQRAFEKRAVSQIKIDRLINEIEDASAIRGKVHNEIESATIGEIVLDKLSRFDQVAYIRFASVYRQFEDIGQFVNEVQRLEIVLEELC